MVVMIILLIQGDSFLQKTDLFDKATLNALKGQMKSERTLLFVILRERTALILSLFLFSTTSLAAMYVYMTVVWFGACSGLFLAVVLLRYGIKGILLLITGIFPHYLIYVPAVILVFRLTKEKRLVNSKFYMQLIVILFVVIIGCLLECYVNPNIVSKMLKLF